MLVLRAATVVAIITLTTVSSWAQTAPTHKLTAALGLMQQSAMDTSGKIDPAKLYFWMTPDEPISGWIHAAVYAKINSAQRVYVASFSCNVGDAPAQLQAVVVGTACNMTPNQISAPSGATLEADMYFSFMGNTDVLSGVAATKYPPQ
jgi:hypothetical protein